MEILLDFVEDVIGILILLALIGILLLSVKAGSPLLTLEDSLPSHNQLLSELLAGLGIGR